jgi:hypothetical protein
MKAVAYAHGPPRIHALAHAFAAGCRLHGIVCRVLMVKDFKSIEAADVVWQYGMGEPKVVFDAYEGKATRLVADKGYWHEQLNARKFFRVSVNGQQPDSHLQLRAHPLDRFLSFGIDVRPVEKRGDYILLCGMGPKQSEILQGRPYGEWERERFKALQKLTKRPILVREKPKNPPIPGLPRCPEAKGSLAIRGAWAVVCNTGNTGADAILHGVPVIAQTGPGAVYGRDYIDGIDNIQPLHPDDRLAALADLSYWHWTLDEMARGLLWANLIEENIV